MDFEKEAQDIADEIERPYISDQEGVGEMLQRLIAAFGRRAHEAGKREAFEEAVENAPCLCNEEGSCIMCAYADELMRRAGATLSVSREDGK